MSEVSFILVYVDDVAASEAEVDALHAEWRAGGAPIALAPTTMDFGYTFVALDPDRQRLRLFASAGRGPD